MAFAMMAIFSLSLVSCGDDDDDDGGSSSTNNQIEINGTKYTVSNLSGGAWASVSINPNGTPSYGAGTFNIGIGSGNSGEIYTFGWNALSEPKVGDDLTKMLSEMDEDMAKLMDGFTMDDDNEVEYSYSSGSAIVRATNKSDDRITIQFNNLKMVNGNRSYTFNGTVNMSFYFDEEKDE